MPTFTTLYATELPSTALLKEFKDYPFTKDPIGAKAMIEDIATQRQFMVTAQDSIQERLNAIATHGADEYKTKNIQIESERIASALKVITARLEIFDFWYRNATEGVKKANIDAIKGEFGALQNAAGFGEAALDSAIASGQLAVAIAERDKSLLDKMKGLLQTISEALKKAGEQIAKAAGSILPLVLLGVAGLGVAVVATRK